MKTIIKISILIFLILSIFSCAKKKVQVPKVALQGKEEVLNNSAIWMFYDENGQLNLNEKNRIGATNWFFNIDRHLKLKQIIPEVNRLFKKHHEKTPHNTAGMANYFTYVNSLNDHLSFYAFDSIHFKLVDKNELPMFSKDTLIVQIKDVNIVLPNTPNGNEATTIQPIYNANLSFQDYFEAKTLLQKLVIKKQISKDEYILKN